MTVHKQIARSPSVTPRPGEVAPDAVTGVARLLQTEDAVPPNVTYHYRLVAVDTNGNRSEPSALVSGQAYQPPPLPPSWNPPERKPTVNPTHVLLSWTHPTDQNLSCLVERCAPNTQLWITVSGWLQSGIYSYEDTPPNLAAAWEYRLRVHDQTGQIAGTKPTVVLSAQT